MIDEVLDILGADSMFTPSKDLFDSEPKESRSKKEDTEDEEE